MRIPHTTAASWPKISAGRFAAGIRRDSPQACAIALLGLPDDTGVKLNHGRRAPRAARGPFAPRWPATGSPNPLCISSSMPET